MTDGTCSSNCPTSTYLNSGGTCSACDPSCQTCVDGTINGCRSCYVNFYYDMNNTECIAACIPALQAIDSSAMTCWTCPAGLSPGLDQCYSCFNTCLTCSGEGYDQCLTCHSDRYVNFGLCVCNEGKLLFYTGTFEEESSCISEDKTPVMGSIVWICFVSNVGLCLLL